MTKNEVGFMPSISKTLVPVLNTLFDTFFTNLVPGGSTFTKFIKSIISVPEMLLKFADFGGRIFNYCHNVAILHE